MKVVKYSLNKLLIMCALYLPVTFAQETMTLTSDSISFGDITLTWSGSRSVSAYPIFENGVHVDTVGGGQTTYTLFGRSQGTKSYRVEGCISWGCQDLTSGNQVVSNTVSVKVGNTISYQIRRHTYAPSMGEALADSTLAGITNILTTVDGSGDIACATQIVREGNVVTFTEGDGSIDSSNELAALKPGINLVDELNFCATAAPNIGGCAFSGDTIAVPILWSSIRSVVWGHEIGHLTGLAHRNGTYTLMNSGADADNRHVNISECNSFLAE